MAIPFATTFITIQRSEPASADTDGYDPNPVGLTTITRGVRAVISTPTANSNLSVGDRVVWDARLTCDPTDITDGDTITDGSGIVWLCLSAVEQQAFGLHHMVCQVRRATGVAP